VEKNSSNWEQFASHFNEISNDFASDFRARDGRLAGSAREVVKDDFCDQIAEGCVLDAACHLPVLLALTRAHQAPARVAKCQNPSN
jgi:hypothetical protein